MALIMDDLGGERKYCKWDSKLIKAYYLHEAYDIDGHPPWVHESPDISWTTKRKKLRAAEVVEAEQERLQNGNSSNHGVRIMAIPKLRDGAKWPTRKSWEERMAAKAEDGASSKMDEVGAAQDERARLKLEALMAEDDS